MNTHFDEHPTFSEQLFIQLPQIGTRTAPTEDHPVCSIWLFDVPQNLQLCVWSVLTEDKNLKFWIPTKRPPSARALGVEIPHGVVAGVTRGLQVLINFQAGWFQFNVSPARCQSSSEAYVVCWCECVSSDSTECMFDVNGGWIFGFRESSAHLAVQALRQSSRADAGIKYESSRGIFFW